MPWSFREMYPQAYLNTFWQMDFSPTVFVAMPFAEDYKRRFSEVVEPAIIGLDVDGRQLNPLRVDLSKSGDSILTDIVDGICHSQLFLADVSTIGRDSKTGIPFRNGNVMYEVGVALACRHPSEVLLIRDDQDRFLFDVSTIPHFRLDFTNTQKACALLRGFLIDRLKQQKYELDARVERAIAGLSSEEAAELMYISSNASDQPWGRQHRKFAGQHELAVSRLLDKQIVRVVGKFKEGNPAFALTRLGQVVAEKFKTGLKQVADTINKQFE
jgi:hypothetical protein